MKNFDYENAGSDELYKWCMEEYSSANPVSKFLINNFYKVLEKEIIAEIGNNIHNIIEIGCGAGESTNRIMKFTKGIKYDATEYDQRYIDAINKLKLPFTVTQETVYDIKRGDNSYDCVVLLEVLEHLDNVQLALNELFRVSSRYVVISIPNEPLWRLLNLIRFKYIKDFGNTPGHINHWSAGSLKKLLSGYGKIIKVSSPVPWSIFLVEKTNSL